MGLRPENQDSPELRGSALLANASHELRTPLNAILGMLELALSEPLPVSLRDYLTTARDSACSLAENLDLLLDLAGSDPREQPLESERIDLSSIAHAAALRGTAENSSLQRQVAVKVGSLPPGELWGDRQRLERLLTALVVHAIRWTPSSRVVIEVAAGQPEAAGVHLEFGVSEFGLGDANWRSNFVLYEPSLTAKYSSAGLDLMLAQRWLGQMNGALWTDSLSACGRFYASLWLHCSGAAEASRERELPVSQPARGVAEPRHALDPLLTSRPQTERPLEVLVVDDTEANQKVVKAVLARRGHRVQLAANGRQALEQVRAHSFDVVLMDAQMPMMNGLEATAAIRRLGNGAIARVPIIAMTAHAFQEDRLRCLAAGMDDYLCKPIDVGTLVARVEFYGNAKRSASDSPRDGAARSKPPPERDFLAGALARLAGDEALLLELIRLFRNDAHALISKIQAGLESGDAELASRAAHNLRGLAANFDDNSTVARAAAVEHAATDHDLAAARQTLPALESDLSHLLDALERYENKHQRDDEL